MGEHGDETVEQAQAVLAQGEVVVHDEHVLEERVDGRAQRREGGEGGTE